MTSDRPYIQVRNLSYDYPAGPGHRQRKALDNVSLVIGKGEFVAIAGPSGCGKSTLCRCLSGLIPFAEEGRMEGDVVLNGASTLEHRPCDIAPLLAMTFQNPDDQLFSNSVEAELAFGPENLGLPREEIRQRSDYAVAATGTEKLRERLIDELSGGEKQRVAIASSMALLPEALVLDEPTSGLDPAGAFALIETLHKLCNAHSKTVVIVEHRLERLYDHITRLVVMGKGKIVRDGPPDEVFRHADLGSFGICEPPAITLRRRYGRLDGKWAAIRRKPDVIRGSCALSIRDVSLAYQRGSRSAIEGISLDFYRGELAFIMGANGSGKTTLAKCMNGLMRPDSGTILIGGRDLSSLGRAAAARQVSLVFQNPDHLLFAETVRDELAFGPGNLGLSAAETDARVQHAAGLLRLTSLLDESPFLLSGGEKQRVAIASVLTMNPPVLVLDEPTVGLDYGLKESLAGILNSLKGAGQAVVVITHDVEFVAAHADRVVLMDSGRVLKDGLPGDILTDPELVRSASLHLPRAAEIGLELGAGPTLTVDDLVPEDGL